jgi:DNA-directed RNA polymerase specialized sigma24 family protein
MVEQPQVDKKDFPETRWSIIVNAGDLDSPERGKALDALFASYLPALKAHLIFRRRIQPDRVDDFLQEFVLKKVLEQNVVAKADSDRGKFRSFILKSLDNFVRDYYRANRMHAQLVELDNEENREIEVADRTAEPDVFEIAWARQVFCTAIQRFRDECDRMGNESRWLMFRERMLSPIVSDQPLDDFKQVAEKYNFESEHQARNVMVSIKRAFDRSLRAVVSECLPDENQIESEMQDVFMILKNSKGLDEAIAEYLPLQKNLCLTEESFRTICVTGLLEMYQTGESKTYSDSELCEKWSEILDSDFEQLKLIDQLYRVAPHVEPSRVLVRDVLFADRPDLRILDLLRGFAKSKYSEIENIESDPVYFVLYMVSIASGVYKHQRVLTRLSVEQLKKNFNWVLEFTWLDAVSHEYLQVAKRVI